MKLLKLTDNIKVIARVIQANSDNDGYCKCQIFKDKKSKCPFDEYYHPQEVRLNTICLNGIEAGKCFCGLYVE